MRNSQGHCCVCFTFPHILPFRVFKTFMFDKRLIVFLTEGQVRLSLQASMTIMSSSDSDNSNETTHPLRQTAPSAVGSGSSSNGEDVPSVRGIIIEPVHLRWPHIEASTRYSGKRITESYLQPTKSCFMI